ncbi:MAG: hypothetical protein AAF740_13990, partial [Bacteroidota bacterium]
MSPAATRVRLTSNLLQLLLATICTFLGTLALTFFGILSILEIDPTEGENALKLIQDLPDGRVWLFLNQAIPHFLTFTAIPLL